MKKSKSQEQKITSQDQDPGKALFEIKEFQYGDVKVIVRIDYQTSEVSLVEYNPSSSPVNYTNKKWLFAHRGLEYMNSWLNILEAMKYAIKEAKKLLEKDLAEKSAFREKMQNEIVGIAINREIANLKDKNV